MFKENQDSSYFDEQDESAGQTKPLIERLVGHVAGVVLVLRLGEAKVGGREGEVEVVESVEAGQEEGGAVYSQAQAVVERVPAGQQSSCLQLLQDQVQPPSPFNLLNKVLNFTNVPSVPPFFKVK